MGTKTLIKQARKELRMQGIELQFADSHDYALYPPLSKNVQLKEEPSEFDRELVKTSLELKDRIHKSFDYILFSKPIYEGRGSASSQGLEADELKKHL